MADLDLERNLSGELQGAHWLLIGLGGLSLVAGVIVLAEPSISLATLAVITGVFMLIDGVVELVMGLVGSAESRGLAVLFGVASAVIGVLLIRHPLHGVVAVALLLGLWLIVAGVVRAVAALTNRDMRNLAVGALEIVVGIVLVGSPGIGVRTLALLAGIGFIARGVALLAAGWLAGWAAKQTAPVSRGETAAAS